MRHAESNIQRQCVKWFWLQYPQFAKLLFAVGNGGARSKIEAAIMNGEGVTAGVSDLILLLGRGGHNALCIEMKSEKGALRPTQREWRDLVERYGSRYVVCRDIYEFKAAVDDYLNR